MMADVRAVAPNGFRAVSTFAGCGGSSLGLRMAGFKMLLANEFIPAAGDTYEANCDPATIVDRRDIRKVTGDSICDAIGIKVGELDYFDGSPPCASFSMAGKRAALWGAVKSYSDTEQRVDDLFGEYLRLVASLQPKVACAENVPGLTIGVARGFYNEIMDGFEAAGYVPAAAILEAEWLGVPQARHRLFFQAIRQDLWDAGLKHAWPTPLTYFYSIRDALPHMARVVIHNNTSSFQKEDKTFEADGLGPTIMAGGMAGLSHYQYHVEAEPGTGADAPALSENARAVADGIAPPEPETDIARFAIGEQWDKMGGEGTQSDKFFQLVRPDTEKPVPTITATAGSPGAASVVHPLEKRKFSVAELRRLCGFPDDFVLTGTYSQQVERLGRAVCPPVTMHLGRAVAEKILRPWRIMKTT